MCVRAHDCDDLIDRVLMALIRRRRRLIAKAVTQADATKRTKKVTPQIMMTPVDETDPDRSESTFDSAIDATCDDPSIFESADDIDDGNALTPSELLIDDVDDNDKSGAMGIGCFTRCCPALLRVEFNALRMFH